MNIHKSTQYPPMEIPILSVDGAYVTLSNLTSLLSTLGSLVIISFYVGKKQIRTTSRFLLVCLSIADILLAVGSVFHTGNYFRSVSYPPEYGFMCQVGAFLYVYSNVLVALWTSAVSFYLFMCVATGWIVLANRILFLFHIFCWLMPFVVGLSADISGVYGYDISDLQLHHHPTSCWISDRVSNPRPWFLLTVEGWVISSMALICLLYLPVTYSIYCKKTQGKEIHGDDVIEELAVVTANEQLRWVPVIYVCTRIWGSMYFLFTRIPDETHLRSYDWLLIIKAIGDNSQGLVNAIFFCLATKQIRQLIGTKFWRCMVCCFGWCRRHKILSEERWMRVPTIVRMRTNMPRRSKNLDGSDLDLTGISLDVPPPEADLGAGEDDIIFER